MWVALMLEGGAAAAPAPPRRAPRVEGRAPPLVDAAQRVPGLVVDLRYATADNFLHRALYPPGTRCLLRAPVAERLARVARALAAEDLRLKVYDCYRPPAVQEEMWKAFPHEGYVANPLKGSIHNRGGAVDVTLVHADGSGLDMPTPFDSFKPAAHQGDTSSSPVAQANRERLRAAMVAQGFRINPKEWWHYSAPEAAHYPLGETGETLPK